MPTKKKNKVISQKNKKVEAISLLLNVIAIPLMMQEGMLFFCGLSLLLMGLVLDEDKFSLKKLSKELPEILLIVGIVLLLAFKDGGYFYFGICALIISLCLRNTTD